MLRFRLNFRGIGTMITIPTNNPPNATPEIPHKTPPSLGRPQHNNRLSMISNQSPKPPILPSLPASYDRFMQNKPNLLDTQMNVSAALTTDYQSIQPYTSLKNKPNSNSPYRRSEFIGACPGAPGTRRQHAGNQPHHPRTDQPTINMQNKPNFPRAKMNLTTYCNTAYRNIRLPGPRKNKPNFGPTASIYKRCTPNLFSLITAEFP